MYKRIQSLDKIGNESCFLWGARQTGKSTLLRQLFPKARNYNLLLSAEFERFNRNPGILREELTLIAPDEFPVIVDEVQRVPQLLNEIHDLIVTHRIPFILCGSSARKLKRGGANLLGGRALRYELFPLVSKEIPDFDLLRALSHGLIPRHYLAEHPQPMVQAYIGDYLLGEIAAEALTRNIPAFGRFLEAAAFSNGELVNYQNIAADCGVSAPTVKEYFQILEDTLIGRFLPSFRKRPKRRVIQSPKFFFFDVGLANFLLKRGPIAYRSESFGKAFEHFIFQELVAHSHYSGIGYPLHTWRTASQLEVDFILADGRIALEVKGTGQVGPAHLKGLKAFCEEYHPQHAFLVSLDPHPRKIDSITILPWKIFLEKLWDGKILAG